MMEQKYDINPLVRIMEKLRDKDRGCEWDKAQSYESIAPYTIEEAYEVADAIQRGDKDDLQDELGDLLLQIIFHSQIATEEDSFNLQNVIDGICNKMIRRHPHIFEYNGAFRNEKTSIAHNWELIKEKERKEKNQEASLLDGVAMALPALKYAEKIQKRAARAGFDWPDSEGAKAKIIEELNEVEHAHNNEELFEEIGDLLFSAVNYSRHLGIAPEEALKASSIKFSKRFKIMEKLAQSNDLDFVELDLDKKEQYWQYAKKKD